MILAASAPHRRAVSATVFPAIPSPSRPQSFERARALHRHVGRQEKRRGVATIFSAYPVSRVDWWRWFKARGTGGKSATLDSIQSPESLIGTVRNAAHKLKTLDSGCRRNGGASRRQFTVTQRRCFWCGRCRI